MATYLQTYNIPDHVKGDTWYGVNYTVVVNSAPLNIAGATIKAEFKHKTCNKKYELSTANGGITIINGAGGIFEFSTQIVDWAAGQYSYDIEFTLSDGSVKTYIGGVWQIVEDVNSVVAKYGYAENSDGTYIESVISGTTLTIPDSIISNSDNSWQVNNPATKSLIVPDTQWTDTDGTLKTSPATIAITCSPPITFGVDIVNSDLTLNDHANDGDTYVVADTTVKNTAGTTILTQPSATSTGVIADCRVVNSDASYDEGVPAETTHVLPDIQFTDSTGAISSVPACKDIVATPAVQTYASAKVMKTGQLTSYRTGDDGDLEAGREASFFVLKANNPFGNTTRFTDELGGATYTNNIVIDWSTFDGTSVLGYYRSYLTGAAWDNQIDACIALSIGSFISGWRMANINEMMNIHKFVGAGSINYAPFNIDLGGYMWTSTSRDGTYAVDILNNAYGGFGIDQQAKSNAYKAVAVRTFSVSGTTLT